MDVYCAYWFFTGRVFNLATGVEYACDSGQVTNLSYGFARDSRQVANLSFGWYSLL
jgi:hypothetical protein